MMPTANSSASDLRIIGAGLPMTGMESLRAALKILGCEPDRTDKTPVWKPSTRKALVPILDPQLPDYYDALTGHISSVDEANCMFVPQLLTALPKARVILTVVDSSDVWWSSVRPIVAHRNLSSSLSKIRVPALGTPMDRSWLNKHRRWVRGAVPKDRLLEYNLRDGWEPLCKFLGVPIPDVPFPPIPDRT